MSNNDLLHSNKSIRRIVVGLIGGLTIGIAAGALQFSLWTIGSVAAAESAKAHTTTAAGTDRLNDVLAPTRSVVASPQQPVTGTRS